MNLPRFSNSKALKLSGLQNQYGLTAYAKTKSENTFNKSIHKNSKKVKAWNKEQRKKYFQDLLLSFR